MNRNTADKEKCRTHGTKGCGNLLIIMVSLVFLFIAQGPRYWHFLPLTMVRSSIPELPKMKWPYLGSRAANQKTKDTFFSSTFNV